MLILIWQSYYTATRKMTTDIDSLLVHHPCCYCGSDEGRVIVRGNDLLEDLPGTFQFVECQKCGLLRQDPRLDWTDLADYYKPGYVCHTPQIQDESGDFQEAIRALGPQKRVNLIKRYQPTGAWLDAGCGSGLILQAAQKQGHWQLSGVEPVHEMAKYTSEKLGVPVFAGTFEEYSVQDSTFDVITMWDVLEHLAEPIKAIEKVSRTLKPNGVFAFSSPNLSSLDRKIFAASWLGYDLPRHLYLFPDSLIRKVLSENGLTVTSRFCFTGSHGAWYLDLAYLAKNHPSKTLEKVLSKGPSGAAFRLLTFLPIRIVDWLKFGTTITYVARKNG